MENNKQLSTELKQETVLVDFQKLFYRLLSAWWLFVLCIGISLAAGHFYLRYATFEYSARAIVLIKDVGSSGGLSAERILLSEQDLGEKSMDNEIQIFKSLTLMEKVVERLDLDVTYFRQGNFKESELYMNSPFLLDSFSLKEDNLFGASYQIILDDYKSFVLKYNEEDPGRTCYFGVPFETDEGYFKITLNPKVAIIKGQHRITVSNIESAAYSYKSQLNVRRVGDNASSSVLELSILSPVGQKASDIVNTLINVYNEAEIVDENQIYENTLDFIDSRVIDLVYELDSVEGGIQRFKSRNELISDDAASSMNYTLGEIRQAIQQISNFEIQKNILESLEKFLTNDKQKIDLIPANLIAENPVLAGLVNQYNGLVLQNKKLSTTASEINPARIQLENEIIDLRGLILETIQNLRRDIQIPIQGIEANIQKLRSSMSNIPSIEKKLVEKMRTQEVKEQLFLFLLQKKEETALSKAVTTAKTRTIDYARTPKFAVYPQRKLIQMVCIAIGILVPILLVLISGLFETKVNSEETIKALTQVPIIGRIAQKKGNDHIIVKHGSRSAVNEMFRLLRTNINFINHGKETQTLLFTSSISGEGKTFIALNLGITIALSDKKVVLLGMDLRKPKMATYMGAEDTNKGITNYLVGQSSLPEILQQNKEVPNLSFITSGPIPPNPTELILNERMEQLLKELAEQFDYILIDTPPIGLVSDALLLRKFVDNIFIVVRQKYTRKIMLRNMEAMRKNNELPKASIIFNGVKQGKKYYGYGGYYYGNNQGYYVDEE